MKITNIRVTPLKMPLRKPYVWAQGVTEHFTVNLVEIEDDSGHCGIGECTTAPDPRALAEVLRHLGKRLIGRSAFECTALCRTIFQTEFKAYGANNPRFANQLLAGLEMALWDLMGKSAGRPVYDLFGGSHRDEVGYFYFLQGSTVEELAADAERAVNLGEPVIYMKVGLGEDFDIQATAAVRSIIGNASLRLDANEAWDVATAIRMIKKLERFDPDFVEQPTGSGSIPALAQVRMAVGVPIAADQAVFTLNDVYEVCRTQAADIIVLGPREIGGIQPMVKAAAVAEAAGMKVCIHSSFTTGITTCAEHQIGRILPNLDYGNQIMWQLMRDNIIAEPDLTPRQGKLSLPAKPGLGFELNREAVVEAAERFTHE
ncbi:mandelate racemase/muconate lactonizing enzyme family protein [Microvirga makkahensis]|uniref:Muconate cycloisomerase n=1 Tax=Microvirga makkahensis TaxID=1128670 RepID=A0A7X3SMX9_9HYPH|nr:mandelate racemase/muconate lactonizing enzyme family protein [Microvirga makkahensis]MXQ10474.1 muconate cycloisomerase [Microvirga makkahensis]